MQTENWASYISCGIAFVALIVTLIGYLSQRRPRIVFYCEFAKIIEDDGTPRGQEAFKEILVAKNIGKTPAMNVHVSFVDKPPVSGQTLATGDRCSVLMPNATHDVYALQREKYLPYDGNDPVTLHVEYEDISLPRMFNWRKHHLHRETQQVSWKDGQSRFVTGGFSENLETEAISTPDMRN